MAEDEAVDMAAALEEFIGRWNLREDSVNLLVTMDPAAQARVLQEFSPRDTSRDANGIFLKFAGGIAAGTPRGHAGRAQQRLSQGQLSEPTAEVEQFVAQWSLGEEAQALLLSLGPQLQAKVLQEFAPRDTTRDANIIFIKFAEGISKGKGKGKGKGKDKGKGGFFQHQAGIRPFLTPSHLYTPPAAHRAPAHAGGYGATSDPQEFIAQWSLGEEAQGLLYSLDPETQAKVMQEFRPRDTSRDVNRIFCKFASGIAEGRDRGGPINAMKMYLQKWNLSPDAQNVFFSLSMPAQLKVMLEFNPRDTSRDVSNIFMKFAQGVDRMMTQGVGYVPKGRPGPY